ncbi:hypothetical protein L7F22_011771 [Adiantum nelumboides]|nr:hypothetical protein [Adiantum nelumboides]
MASFSCIHQAIARLQAVSASHLHLEPISIGPFRLPFDRKLQALTHFKKPELSIHSAVRSGFLVFATASQDTATPTLVLQEVDFVWKGEGAQVLLTGDFLGWDTKVSLVKGTDGAFHCKQKLSPGTYKYKYIVDGKWAHSPDSPMIEDGQGGYNNQITITDGPTAAASIPSKESLPKETAGVKDMAEALPKAGVSTKAAEADTISPAPKPAAPPKAAAAASTKAAEGDAITAAKAAVPPKAAAAASTKAAEADTITATASPKAAAAASTKAAEADTITATASPKAPAAASTKAAEADTTLAAAPKAADPPKATPAAKPAKKVEKPYPQVITEDVIPRVKSHLQKEEGVSDINLVFEDNQLEGSFLKSGIVYTFWAFFPDGKLEGARGFSVSSHGSPPSTVEPFLIDEKRITADLLVFWILKRLAAQSIISSKRV